MSHSGQASELRDLQVKANEYFYSGLANNTHRTYSSAQRQYLEFCDKHGLKPLPGDETTLILFITHLAQRIKPQSIKVYMAGVRALHISNGYHNPLTDTIKLKQTLRGIERKHFSPVQQKLPITFDLLCKMYTFIDLANQDDTVYWSAMTMAHFLLLRASEFMITDSSDPMLTLSDVNITTTANNDEYLALHVKTSKTDQKRQGVTLYTGHAKHTVCAVCSMKSNIHLQRLRSQGRSDGPLFGLSSGSTLTRSNMANYLSVLLRLLGIDSRSYSTHSFRIGGATSAATAGLKDYEIKLLGRWTSDYYKRYIRSPVSLFTSIAEKISKTEHSTYQYANPYTPTQV